MTDRICSSLNPLRFGAEPLQVDAQAPQPLHRTSLTTATSLASSIEMALNGQTLTQAPQALQRAGLMYAVLPPASTVSFDSTVTALLAGAMAWEIGSSTSLG